MGEEDDTFPGFTATLMLLAAIITVAIYHKKRR
ncbi:MAG: Loki-CTERM sorting domain-containing protein [Thermoplasmata archaeon]